MPPLTVHGVPVAPDPTLSQRLHVAAWGVGGVGGVALAALGAWWWVPAPLVVAGLAAAYVAPRLADRPLRVTVSDATIDIDDPLAPPVRVATADVWACALSQRRRGDGFELVAALQSRDGPLLAIAAQLDAPHPTATDIDALDATLGAGGGLLRSLCTRDRAVRQRIASADFIDALAARWPAPRVALRLWQGVAPELSVFGLHTDLHDATLLIDGDDARLRTADGEHPLGPLRHASVARRPAVLLGDGGPGTAEIPLLILAFDAASIAIPAPALADPSSPVLDDPTTFHTHAAEGARLLPLAPHVQRASVSDSPSPPPGVARG